MAKHNTRSASRRPPVAENPSPAPAQSDNSEQRAREEERLAFAGRLAGGLMHEIKNPLSTLNLNLQLMAEDLVAPQTETEQRLARKVEVLRQETRRLSEILDKFMRFVGRLDLRKTRQNVGEVVLDLLAFYEPQAAVHHITLRSSVPHDLPPVEADADLLKQALLNLILNAQNAMPDGGELMVAVRRQDDGVAINVTDTGCGIPPDLLPRIFEAYYSTRRNGTGLGLPITRRIVREHGGRISVSSEIGRGTQFSVWLPSARDESAAAAAPHGAAAPEQEQE